MDSNYLKEHVGHALTVGLAEVVQRKPTDPIDFLCNWLRKYVENREEKRKAVEESFQIEKEKEIAEEENRRLKAMLEEQEQIASEASKKEEAEKLNSENDKNYEQQNDNNFTIPSVTFMDSSIENEAESGEGNNALRENEMNQQITDDVNGKEPDNNSPVEINESRSLEPNETDLRDSLDES